MSKFLLCFVLPVSCIESHVWVKEFTSEMTEQKAAKPFSFASYYENHMVLQAAPQQAIIWGYNTPDTVGQMVSLTILELKKTYTGVVGPDYKWSVKLDPVDADGPYTLLAESGGKKIGLQDVLFGDVWVCSGQSNMKFPISEMAISLLVPAYSEGAQFGWSTTPVVCLWMSEWSKSSPSPMRWEDSDRSLAGVTGASVRVYKVFNGTEEMKDAVNYPNIRVFIAAEKESTTPLNDLAEGGIFQPWSLPATGNFSKFSAVCWLYGKYLYGHLKKPLGLIDTAWGGTPVEAWSSPDALERCGLSNRESKPVLQDPAVSYSNKDLVYDGITGPQESSVLWNAMIHPFLNMTIYGAIWYQGENNVKVNMNKYNCTFPAMIDDWRKKFHQSSGTTAFFPFGFVQLAGYRPVRSIKVGFPDIRWHQTADYGYAPNHRQQEVFMAVAMDLPDFLCPIGPVGIHPRDKQDVAYRLVQSSLAVAYDQPVVYQGPFPVHLTNEDWAFGAKVKVIYNLPVEERNFEGFEICCSLVDPPVCTPGKSWWIPAAVISDSEMNNSSVSTLLIPDCKRQHIMGIRYGWSESPCAFKKCAIYGMDSGLPSPPFTFSGEEFLRLGHQ